jgi:hypothetical protein
LEELEKMYFHDLEPSSINKQKKGGKSVNTQLTQQELLREWRKISKGEKIKSEFLCWGLCYENCGREGQ